MMSSPSIPPRPAATLLVSYFGKWPLWFPAFLHSCRHNPRVEWLLLTDCPDVGVYPPNVRPVRFTLDELNRRASDALGMNIQKRIYSQCDLRPAYGVIFADLLRHTPFWGHCDVDMIFGSLDPLLRRMEDPTIHVISPARNRLVGHCTFYRNDAITNELFRTIPEYQRKLENPRLEVLDERQMDRNLRGRADVKVSWPQQLTADWPELDLHATGWQWREGKLTDTRGRERVAMHFMHWKSTMRIIDFGCEDEPAQFVITPRSIRSRSAPLPRRLVERVPDWKRVKRLAARGRGMVAGRLRRLTGRKPAPKSR